MTEKAKCKNCTDEMIEEMAELMTGCVNCKAYGECFSKCSGFISNRIKATILVREGYRKILEGSVVLSKEQNAKWSELFDQTRKETAKEILKKGEEFYKMSYHKRNAIHRLAEWIKDIFGVEVEE